MGIDDLKELQQVLVRPLDVIVTAVAWFHSLTDYVLALYTDGAVLKFSGLIVGRRRWYFIIGFGKTEPRFHENDTGGWN
jgi:hypothetical protein